MQNIFINLNYLE